MGADWRDLTWQDYQLHLAAWNAAHADENDRRGPSDPERLTRFMAAHSVH
jgi:hypothetical protein